MQNKMEMKEYSLTRWKSATNGKKINSYKELRVYRKSMDLAMEIFEITKGFPQVEKYSLVDQMPRASRSVWANLAEPWRKRRYEAAFIAKLNAAKTEACETQIWIEFSLRCQYIDEAIAHRLDQGYEHVLSQLIRMIDNLDKWLIKPRS